MLDEQPTSLERARALARLPEVRRRAVARRRARVAVLAALTVSVALAVGLPVALAGKSGSQVVHVVRPGPTTSVPVTSTPATSLPRGANSSAPTSTPAVQLRGSDTAPDDNFGSSVSLSGNEAIIGAPAHGGGRAYIFTLTSTGWRQTAELDGPDSAANDQFGSSVQISGDTALVGAPGHQGGGRVYVFTDRSSQWRLAQELTGSNTASNDQFGSALVITGATLVVGAPGRNQGTGAAYVFTRGPRGWGQTAQLGKSGTTGAGTDSAAGDAFGSGVDASGDSILIGAAMHLNGTVYVFSHTATWRLDREIGVNPGVSGFGNFFAVSDSTLFVTLTGGHKPLGQTAVFARTASGWKQVGRLTVSNPSPEDYFYSNSVSLAGSTAVVCRQAFVQGAPANANRGNDIGAYVFHGSASGWKLAGTIPGSGQTGFCSSVSASGEQALIGSTGIAYLYHT